MNEQQLAAVKQALEVLEKTGTECGSKQFEIEAEAITAIKQALAAPVQEPVGWHSKLYGFVYMAKQPHEFEIGSIFYLKDGTPAWRVESNCSKTALISMANLPHGTVFYTTTPAQPAPVQEPVAIVVAAEYEDGSTAGHRLEWRGRNEANDFPEGTEFYTAAQPVPVKTYHDGKPWPVVPKPWVGLTKEDREFIELTGGKSDVLLAELVEAKLKEKNHG